MWLYIVLTIVIGYLLGNFNGAVFISKLVAHEDVREHGSGNAGLTNFIRNYGAVTGLLVIAIDGGKTVLGCLDGGFLLKTYGLYTEGMAIGAVAVMLGHVFPVFLGFKGGKGVLSGAFIAFTIDWRIGLLILAVFACAYLLTWYVSLGSVLAAAAFGIGFVIFHYNSPVVMGCGLGMAVLCIVMHRENIVRLIHGNERKTNLFGKGRKQ